MKGDNQGNGSNFLRHNNKIVLSDTFNTTLFILLLQCRTPSFTPTTRKDNVDTNLLPLHLERNCVLKTKQKKSI